MALSEIDILEFDYLYLLNVLLIILGTLCTLGRLCVVAVLMTIVQHEKVSEVGTALCIQCILLLIKGAVCTI